MKHFIYIIILLVFQACSKTYPDDSLLYLFPVLSVSTNPSDGYKFHRLTDGIVMTFNLSMDASSMTSQAVSGSCSGNIQVSTDDIFLSNCIGGKITGTGTAWTFTPAVSFDEEKLYYFRITAGVKADAESRNAVLSNNYNISFTTEDLPVLSNLIAWYKTNQTTYSTLNNGDEVISWKDSKSPFNHTGDSVPGSPPTGWAPEYLSAFTNGRSAMRFRAANEDHFELLNPVFSPLLSGNTGFTVFMVFKTEEVSGLRHIFDISVNLANDPRFKISNNFGAFQLETRKADNDITDTVQAGVLNPANYNIGAVYVDYTLNETGIFLEDGSSFSSNEKTVPAWDATPGTTCSTSTPTGFLMGLSNTHFTANLFDGSISDVIIYNVRLTKAERESVICFLGRKFNITINNSSPCL